MKDRLCRLQLASRFLIMILLVSPLTWSQDATVTLESRVTGNQEQPKVLYIVPWKSPGTSADLYNPVSSQLSAIFDHVERAELRRQIHYLDVIKLRNKLISNSNEK